MRTNPNDFISPQEERTSQYSNVPDTYMWGGLTKREFFSAMAMIGLQASNIENEIQAGMTVDQIASLSVIQADRLIKELNKEIESEPVR